MKNGEISMSPFREYANACRTNLKDKIESTPTSRKITRPYYIEDQILPDTKETRLMLEHLALQRDELELRMCQPIPEIVEVSINGEVSI
jgi:hypothetical protein